MERPGTRHDGDRRGMRTRFSRRTALKGALSGASAATLAAILAACGGGGAPPNPPTTAPTSAPPATTGTGATTAPATRAAGSAPAATQATGSSPTGGAGTVAPTAQAAAGTPKRGGVLVVGVTTDIATLEPHKDAATGRSLRTQLMYNYLVQADQNLQIQPDVAEKWDVSPDAKTYTFTIRKGIKFHNGRELVASDVKYTIERILDPATAAYGSGFLNSIDTVEAPDPYTLKLNLKTPNAGLLASLASSFAGIVAKEEVDKAGGALNKSDGGSGPFMLDEWVQGQYLKLKRNPNYYIKDLPYLDGITYQVIPEETSIISQLKSGNVDMVSLGDLKNYDLVKDQPNLTALRYGGEGMQYVNIDNTKEPFNKLEVRQAMSYAVDRPAVLAAAINNVGTLTAPIPPALKDYALDPATLPQLKQDLAKAKDLMAKAGYPNGFKTELQVIVGFPANINGGQVVADNLKKIGIDAQIKQVEYGTWIKGFQNHEFILTMNGTAGNPDPDSLLSGRLGSKGANNNNWKDDEVDNLLAQGRATPDMAKRKEIYAQLQRVLLDKAPQIWLYAPDIVEVMKKSVKGYVPNPSSFMPGLISAYLDR
jgi:peptide/nickel transport system substrate-binding protein